MCFRGYREYKNFELIVEMEKRIHVAREIYVLSPSATIGNNRNHLCFYFRLQLYFRLQPYNVSRTIIYTSYTYITISKVHN